MRRVLVCAATTLLVTLPVLAALPDGTKAPDINTAANNIFAIDFMIYQFFELDAAF